MATLQEVWDAIELSEGYVTNSIYLKSCNETGASIKYLVEIDGVANRKQFFYALSDEPYDHWGKTVLQSIEVIPAQ